ncbi:MAG: type II CAAX endopeptidase family protein [Bacillota bacterium]|nr:type II CAAX endopeptidase family protein [Bacillota bacterium]
MEIEIEMEDRKVNKELANEKLIRKFLLINFGLTFLFGFFLYLGKTRGNSGAALAALQMFFPALAAIITVMTSGLDIKKTTKNTYLVYIIISIGLMINAVLGIFIEAFDFTNALMLGGSVLFLISLLKEKKHRRQVANLSLGKKTKVLGLSLVFLVLYFLRPGLIALVSGDFSSFTQTFTVEKIVFALAIIISFPLSFLAFFGEEYGWRYFLQPLVQEKYGMTKGLIFIGLIWGIWHLPLNMFYYSAEGSQLQSLVNQILICIGYSIFFGYAYTKTDSIWTVSLIHYLNNNLILMFTDGFDPSVIENQLIGWSEVAIMGATTLILFGSFIFSKYNKDEKYLLANPLERFASLETKEERIDEKNKEQ